MDGVDLETCLGDLYSVSWMEDTDAHHGAETLGTQLADVKKRTNKSRSALALAERSVTGAG